MNLSFIKTNKLLKAYDTIRTSFWFVPGIIILSTTLLCFVLLWIDNEHHFDNISWLNYFYNLEGGIARALLTTIAGSVMTVVSITFSITMVALTNASSQFGPRLIRNFMNDPSTQMVLGSFTSIFVYCLILAGATDDFASGDYLPGLTFAGAIVLTTLGILLLIYFIHHVAVNLQADNVIDKVSTELETNIANIFNERKNEEQSHASHSTVLDNLDTSATLLKSTSSGYVQAVNYPALIQLMSNHESYLNILVTPGDFVVNDMIIMQCSHSDLTTAECDELISYITFGAKRTPLQDAEFAILQLVELALRALSPSINDPYSAIACIDKLTATICNLTRKRFPEGVSCDSNDEPRVVFKTATFSGIANSAYDQIRQHSTNNLAVQLRLLEALTHIAAQAKEAEHWKVIEQQKNMLEYELEQQVFIGHDQAEINERLSKLNTILATQTI